MFECSSYFSLLYATAGATESEELWLKDNVMGCMTIWTATYTDFYFRSHILLRIRICYKSISKTENIVYHADFSNGYKKWSPLLLTFESIKLNNKTCSLQFYCVVSFFAIEGCAVLLPRSCALLLLTGKDIFLSSGDLWRSLQKIETLNKM